MTCSRTQNPDGSTVSATITATHGMLAPSARTPLPARSSSHTQRATAPESALSPIRYVCLDCSDTDVQVLGWGRTCWHCHSTRLAPASTIANTRPGTSCDELLTRWRHLIR